MNKVKTSDTAALAAGKSLTVALKITPTVRGGLCGYKLSHDPNRSGLEM